MNLNPQLYIFLLTLLIASVSSCGQSVRNFGLNPEEVDVDELVEALKKAEESGIPGTNIAHISETLTTLEEINLIEETNVVDTSIFACLKDGVTEISPEHLANFGHVSFIKTLGSVEVVYYLSLRLYAVLEKLSKGNPDDLTEMLYYFSIPITKRIRDYYRIKATFLNFLPRFHWYGLIYMYHYFYIEFPDIYNAMLALRPNDERLATLIEDRTMLNAEELETLRLFNTEPGKRERIAALPVASQYCNGFRLGDDVIPCKEWFDLNMQLISGTPAPEDSCPSNPFPADSIQAGSHSLSKWEACYYKDSTRDKSQNGIDFELNPSGAMENFSSIVCDQPNPSPPPDLFITPVNFFQALPTPTPPTVPPPPPPGNAPGNPPGNAGDQPGFIDLNATPTPLSSTGGSFLTSASTPASQMVSINSRQFVAAINDGVIEMTNPPTVTELISFYVMTITNDSYRFFTSIGSMILLMVDFNSFNLNLYYFDNENQPISPLDVSNVLSPRDNILGTGQDVNGDVILHLSRDTQGDVNDNHVADDNFVFKYFTISDNVFTELPNRELTIENTAWSSEITLDNTFLDFSNPTLKINYSTDKYVIAFTPLLDNYRKGSVWYGQGDVTGTTPSFSNDLHDIILENPAAAGLEADHFPTASTPTINASIKGILLDLYTGTMPDGINKNILILDKRISDELNDSHLSIVSFSHSDWSPIDIDLDITHSDLAIKCLENTSARIGIEVPNAANYNNLDNVFVTPLANGHWAIAFNMMHDSLNSLSLACLVELDPINSSLRKLEDAVVDRWLMNVYIEEGNWNQDQKLTIIYKRFDDRDPNVTDVDNVHTRIINLNFQ
jgi:hypothetical protein